MSNDVLNDVISFNFPYRFKNTFKNTVLENAAQTTGQVIEHSTHDYMEFRISIKNMTTTQRDDVWEHMLKHKGQSDTFLFKDEWGYGYQVARQSIGTGDAAEDEFQLIETVGSNDFNRYNIIAASVSVWVNNVAQTEGGGADYTVDYTDSGIVTFNGGSIPGAGHDVEALFEYYRRVRCMNDLEGIFKNSGNRITTMILKEVIPAL